MKEYEERKMIIFLRKMKIINLKIAKILLQKMMEIHFLNSNMTYLLTGCLLNIFCSASLATKNIGNRLSSGINFHNNFFPRRPYVLPANIKTPGIFFVFINVECTTSVSPSSVIVKTS